MCEKAWLYWVGGEIRQWVIKKEIDKYIDRLWVIDRVGEWKIDWVRDRLSEWKIVSKNRLTVKIRDRNMDRHIAWVWKTEIERGIDRSRIKWIKTIDR